MKTFGVAFSLRSASRALVAVLALVAASVHASDFYKLTLIYESDLNNTSPDWSIVGGGGLGLNNSGVVVWRSDGTFGGVTQSALFSGDGITLSAPIAPGPLAWANRPSINNFGQIGFVGIVATPTGNEVRVRVWDQGALSDLFLCSAAVWLCNSAHTTLSDNVRTAAHNALNFAIVGTAGQVFASGPKSDTSVAEPVVSRNGRIAALAARQRQGTAVNVAINVLDLARPGQVGYFTLGAEGNFAIKGLSTNDRGVVAYLSEKGSGISAIVPYVGVVNSQSGTSIRIADTTGGTFIDFGAGGLGSPSINNLNEVAFPANRNTTFREVFVGDVSSRQPTPVVLGQEVVTSDGARFQGVMQHGFYPQSMNDKGQIAFTAFIQRGTTNRAAVLRADPLPGVSPGNPIMPAPGASLPSGWRFVLPCTPAALCLGTAPRRYIDPPLAVGYTYQVEAPGPNFATVHIPAPLVNGDDTFQVEFNGRAAPIRAGQEFDFTTIVPGGVSSFRITGIDTAEALDPTNAAAFVTGLSFATDAATDFTVTMVPIVEDPDDLDRDGVPNAADLCPNTTAGAVVDANGCSASQRDSDGDGVVDNLDQCPATPLGTAVDANGCSALQLDADGDGVPNTADACPNTVPGAAVDARGCSAEQRDGDGDGVADSIDQCPNTPAGMAVNSVGCAVSQLDADGDGVPDSLDQCPNTPPGSAVNSAGCASSQLDSDGDGVPDSVDTCPGTPAGTPVDGTGCPVQTPAQICDVNGDKSIDYRDIRLILLAISKPSSGPTDPRDANRNGKIDLLDAAICTARCSRVLCLAPR